ncbi:MAG TPA: alpha/beta hydrolase [Bacteroidetes bacterium]|nr:alpha/beta hydrolase [Bacteroidota bacterium]
MKKTILKIFAVIISLLILLFILGYQSDIPINELEEKYANAESEFIKIDGMDVHYRIEGQGRPLVLIHGTGASLHTWDKWTEQLKDSFEIIRMDLPAFGLTGPNKDGDYSMEFYTRFLNRFLQKINVDSFYLAGNSLGGRIAWNYAAAYPQQIKKLILIDAAGAPNDKGLPLVFKLARNPVSAVLFRYVLPKSFIEKNMKEVYFDDAKITSEIIDRYHSMALRPGNRQAFIDRANMDFPDRTAILSKIICPTLIMWGRHDEWIPVGDAAFFDKKIPNSKVVIYENAGHVPMEEIGTETAEDARAFLEN